jgi:hypothetical protein
MTTFRLATEDDDELLRSILRDNAMPTWVDMAITREPLFFAGKNVFGEDWAVVAEEKGDVIGIYTASVLPLHVDGHPERLGYLGGLRVRPGHRQRIRHLREGYRSIRQLAPVEGSVPWWFTVIAAENAAARRLLESGITGLPAYHAQGEYVTFALATSRGRRHGLWHEATEAEIPAIVRFHNEQAARFQCSPVLDDAVVRRVGRWFWSAAASSRRFSSRGSSGKREDCDSAALSESGSSTLPHSIDAVACLWDQRAFKQIVARRYRMPIGTLRPLYNLYARLAKRIPLPKEGGALDQTFIAFLAFKNELSQALIEDLLSHCHTPAASIGLHAENPLVPIVKRMKPIAYPARVYAVTFDGAPPQITRPVQPEAALL